MTPDDIRHLGPMELARFYASLRAVDLPKGRFIGIAWSHDLPFIGRISKFWNGKIFETDAVWNRILGQRVIPGRVALDGDRVLITYPQLGLTDTLKPVDDTLWVGRLQLGASVVWFTLEADV